MLNGEVQGGAVCTGLAAGHNFGESDIHAAGLSLKSLLAPSLMATSRDTGQSVGRSAIQGPIFHRGRRRGIPARSTRRENPRPFSNGSTVAVTSSTG